MTLTLPIGFNPIAAGFFQGVEIASFGFKQTPVTNQEFGEVGRNQFVLLDHNWETGETTSKKSGKSIEEVVSTPTIVPEGTNFDQGGILVLGSMILLKMLENPSAQYDEKKRVFSGAKQPAVGITYFHAKTWCLLKTLESGGEFVYDLPTDAQYEYVASDRGTKEYGTETGTLYKGKKKLAHIDEYKNGKGTTVAVDDMRYKQELPFGVQTTGNVWRWSRFNPKFKRSGEYFSGPYGLRGASWGDIPGNGRASIRDASLHPNFRFVFAGFSPVVIHQDSP